jgi:hypothetical protein
MKKLHTLLAVILITATTFAQVPESMSYQAIVRDSGGNLVSNLPVGMQISILQGSSSGTVVYAENHTESTNVNGLVTLEIGLGTATTGTFAIIDWAAGPYFIKTETDPTGGTNYTITGTSQLMSVPYALYAKTSGSQLTVSTTGDTLHLQNGGFVIIPGISAANTPAQLATLTTTAISNLTDVSATTGGNITNDGGAPITQRGVCYGTSTNPTTANSTTNDGSGTGSFNSNLSGLTENTSYYVRAYATNSAGTAYGNEVSFTTPLAIGSSYQGGIVFYLDGFGGGLIAAPSNQSTGAKWGCQGTLITGADGTAIGTGNQNTIDIEAGCTTAGTAADICANLTLGGYSDWFLPSKDELNQMYLNKAVIGGFGDGYYWSSSENSLYTAWAQGFYYGYQNANHKSRTQTSVRAVRAF